MSGSFKSSKTMLAGLRVLELEGPFTAVCTRFLASMGAEVIKLVSPARGAGHLLDDLGKRCAPLDLDRAEDRTHFAQRVADADVLLESAPPGWLAQRGFDPASLAARNPRLLHATITEFGSSGPYAGFRGSELVASAMGGVLRTVGYEDRAPVKEALDACGFHAAAAASAALMLAYYAREASGLGQHVDVSLQEVAASRTTNGVLLWQFDRRKVARSGNALRYGNATVRCVWELADGHVFHSLMSGRFGAPANQALSQWIDEQGLDNPLRDVDWLRYDRSALPAETRARWEAAIDRFFRAQTKAVIAREGRRRGINAAVVQAPADILADPQLDARGFLRRVTAESGRAIAVPNHFVQTDRGECSTPAAQHEANPPAFLSARTTARASRRTAVPPGTSALAGVKVLDLSWALVGSLTTKALADHGATVVKVESSTRPCLTRTDVQVAVSTRQSMDDKPWFALLNTSKLGLQLNIKHARAREVLDPLLAWADVVVENFSPGTLEKLGLDYATLRRRKPELIMVSGSGYGQTGPLAREWGVDGTGAALSGRLALTGWPDRAPVAPASVPYGDVILPQLMVAACVAALVDRDRGAGGRQIDAAMYEACVQQMGAALVGAQLNAPLQRNGNREPGLLLQGVFPTAGDDRWIALSVFDAEDWARLTAFMGGDWPAADALPAAAPAQLDALDARIAQFTRAHEDRALMHALQARGIAAGVVQDCEDLLERDPQLNERGAFPVLDHPVLGRFAHQATPYQLPRNPARMAPAPLLGQHSESVCRELAGLDADHFAALQREGVFV